MTSPLVEQHKPLLAQHGLHFRKANAVRRASHLVEELLPAGHSSSEKCEAALKPSRSNRRRRQRQEPEAESFGRPDARAEGFQEFARIGHFQQTVKTHRYVGQSARFLYRSSFRHGRSALPKKRCLELSGAQNSQHLLGLESSRHLFLGKAWSECSRTFSWL